MSDERIKCECGQYILKDGIPVLADDLIEWAKWMETGDRIVVQETIGAFFISTVFLGMDMSFCFGVGEIPILYETMIFNNGRPPAGELDDWQMRAPTRGMALDNHAVAVSLVHKFLAIKPS